MWRLKLGGTCHRREIGSEGAQAELRNDGVQERKRMLEERLAAQGTANDVVAVVLYMVSGK